MEKTKIKTKIIPTKPGSRLFAGKKFKGFTDFQLKVWEEVLKIPLGRTRSYSWVASRIGSPQAVRAVGTALKNNPYPIVIPCHRVVKSNGDIGGYSSGKEVKKKLIQFEKRLKKILSQKRKRC